MTRNDSAPALRTTQLGFMLIDGFALMSYASIIEPFRAANVLSASPLYAWRHFSVDGRPVRASNGIELVVDGMLDPADGFDLLFVCAGGNPAEFSNRTTLAQLRQAASRGARIGGVSGGPFIMARAGLLDGYRCTIHWEHETGFIEAFPRVAVERGLYVIDRDRLTCAGGTAGLDLAIELIGDSHGSELAALVGEWHIRTQERAGEGAQRVSLAQRYRSAPPGLLAALQLMSDTVAEPVSRQALAKRTGVSVRQLERLFRAHVGRTIGQEYLRLRLDTAMLLLRDSSLSRIEITVACGFSSATHFSRAFRKWFAMTPTQARQAALRPVR